MISVEVARGPHEKLLVIVDGVRLLTDWDDGFEIDAGGELPIVARFIPEESRPPVSGMEVAPDFALAFDGASSAVRVDSFHYDGSHPITLEAWCTPANNNHQATVIHSGGPLILLQQGRFWQTMAYVERDKPLGRMSDGLVSDGEYLHTAAVYDGQSIKLFVDGILQDDRPVATLGANAEQIENGVHLADLFKTARLSIGAPTRGVEAGHHVFHGIIDEVRISSIARYTEDFAPEERFSADEDTLALYHFDEGDGDELLDSSGNGHHGAITGAQWVRIDGDEVLPVEVPTSPRDPPALAVTPFDANEAHAYQQAWADHVGEAVEFRNSIGMKFRVIPPGRFLMGSTEDETLTYQQELGEPDVVNNYGFERRIDAEKPQHTVELTQPVYFGEHEVTQTDYREVMQATPSHFSSGGEGSNHVQGVDTDVLPVETIGWLDAVEFCNRLSLREGLAPCYEIEGSNVNWLHGNGYRLPTEAEWEFAARAGSNGRYFFDDTAAQIDNFAWTVDNSDAVTHPVGLKLPNPFGLHDVYGNVWEWCFDAADSKFYESSPGSDPVPTSQSGQRSAGGWPHLIFANLESRSASRGFWDIHKPIEFMGFRVVRTIDGGRRESSRRQGDFALQFDGEDDYVSCRHWNTLIRRRLRGRCGSKASPRVTQRGHSTAGELCDLSMVLDSARLLSTRMRSCTG